VTARTYIDRLFEELPPDLPDIVYHGTTEQAWSQKGTRTLYLTREPDEASSYAEHAAESGGRGIVVEFLLKELLNLATKDPGVDFDTDWGWIYGESELGHPPSWEESLEHVGSFSVAGFKHKYKALGTVTPA
jgi:hypothetical protein